MRVTNSGSIGYSLKDPVFTLYGISYVKGYPKETPLCDLTPVSGAGSFSLAPSTSTNLQLKATDNLELDEVKKVLSYSLLKIGCSFPNITYLLENGGSEIGLEKTMTDVMASTAQLTVDFDGAKKGQGNINKKIATLTKYNPSGTSAAERYGKVFLGELLKTAGLTYTFDTLGFIGINGLERDKNNVWVTQIIHPETAGGAAADTVEVRMGAHSGPDSVVIRTGDLVYVTYSGDDNRDSVSNAVAKMYGIYDEDTSTKQNHDFDNDDVSNYQEIYGWVASGSTDTIRTSPRDPDSDGDGIPDGEDPLPLSPRLASSSNVQSLSVLDARDSIVETITFGATEDSKVLSKDVPCTPRFQVTVDTMPLWCKLVVNGNDTLALIHDTTIVVTGTDGKSQKTLYRFIDNPTATRKMIPLGNVTVKVITRPLDKSKTQIWNISGKSGLVNIMGKPVVESSPVATTLEGKWWRQLQVSIYCKEQHQSDPRATGYIVVRSTDSTKAFDVSTSTKPLGASSYNSWVVCNTITGDDKNNNVRFLDTGLVSGTTYFYRVIPFFTSDNVDFTYGTSPAEAMSSGVRTWKIMVQPYYDKWRCDDEGDGSGTAELKWKASIKKSVSGTPGTTTLKSWGEILQEDVEDGTERKSGWDITQEFKENENVICWFWMYEDDNTFDDYLWDEDVLNINVGTMINWTKDNISATGPLTKNKDWDTGKPLPFIPTSTSKNRVHFWQQKSTDDEPTTVTIHWYIHWWFE